MNSDGFYLRQNWNWCSR